MRNTWLMIVFAAGPAAAQAQAPLWHLELIHRVQPGDASPSALGQVAQLALLADGSVYVAEKAPARVTLYDAQGRFVREIMRQGEGPGEVRVAEIASAGDTLIAYDPALGRLSRVTRGGKPISQRFLGVTYPLSPLYSTAAGDVIVTSNFTMPPMTGNFVRVAANGHVDTVGWTHPESEDRSLVWKGPHWTVKGITPFSPYGEVTFDPRGRMIIGGTKASRWAVVVGSDTVQTVSLPDRVVPIATAVRDSAYAAWRSHMPKSLPDADAVLAESKFPSTLPPWLSINIDRAGNWWVGRPDGRGMLGAWDIISGGKLAGRIAVPEKVSQTDVGPVMSFANDLVALAHETPDGVPWIGVYRVVRH